MKELILWLIFGVIISPAAVVILVPLLVCITLVVCVSYQTEMIIEIVAILKGRKRQNKKGMVGNIMEALNKYDGKEKKK